MFATLSKPILVCGLTWVFAGSLALTALPLPTDQQSAPQEALQKSKETSVDDKVVSELLKILLEQETLDNQSLRKIIKYPAVAAIMVDLYRDYAIQAEPDCKDLFDVNNNYVTATIAMEPYGKINSTGFDPATNGARPITNRVVKAKTIQRVLERIQDVMGQYHPEAIRSPRIPGLTFEFQGYASTGGPSNPKHAQFICLIKPE